MHNSSRNMRNEMVAPQVMAVHGGDGALVAGQEFKHTNTVLDTARPLLSIFWFERSDRIGMP